MLGLREQGTQAEREERWADAVGLYQQALEIDALMLFATEGVAAPSRGLTWTRD